MKLNIISVGKSKTDKANNGSKEYLNKLAKFHNLSRTIIDDKQAQNPQAFLQAINSKPYVALDEHGIGFDSQSLAAWLDQRANHTAEVAFVIGGANGLPMEVKQKALLVLSLSPMTLPPELALLLLTEALYRASTLSAGRPYHKVLKLFVLLAGQLAFIAELSNELVW